MSVSAFLTVCIVLFCTGIAVGATSGGVAMLLTAIGTMVFGSRASVSFNAIVMLIAQSISAVALRKHIRWDIVVLYAVPGSLGGMLGARMLFLIPEWIPKMLLGAFCLLFVLRRICKKKNPATEQILRKKKENDFSLRRIALFAVVAFPNGMLAGMTRSGSVLRSSLLLSEGLPPQTFIATSAMIATLQLSAQIFVYAAEMQWTKALGLTLLAAIMFVPIGVCIGHKILKEMSATIFEQVQLLIMIVAGLWLLFSSLFP